MPRAQPAVVNVDQDVGVDNSTFMQFFSGPPNLAISPAVWGVADSLDEAALRGGGLLVLLQQGSDGFGDEALLHSFQRIR